jgi:predicted DNA-binding transcriptional regulator YafY
MFAPGRIRSVRETGERIERPADFRITDYLDRSFKVLRGEGPARRVRLRFAPEMARYVREKVWHPSQQLQERRDGSLVQRLTVNHLLEVKRWVLSYGAACEVLEPSDLRAEIEAELRQMMNRYR